MTHSPHSGCLTAAARRASPFGCDQSHLVNELRDRLASLPGHQDKRVLLRRTAGRLDDQRVLAGRYGLEDVAPLRVGLGRRADLGRTAVADADEPYRGALDRFALLVQHDAGDPQRQDLPAGSEKLYRGPASLELASDRLMAGLDDPGEDELPGHELVEVEIDRDQQVDGRAELVLERAPKVRDVLEDAVGLRDLGPDRVEQLAQVALQHVLRQRRVAEERREDTPEKQVLVVDPAGPGRDHVREV